MPGSWLDAGCLASYSESGLGIRGFLLGSSPDLLLSLSAVLGSEIIS